MHHRPDDQSKLLSMKLKLRLCCLFPNSRRRAGRYALDLYLRVRLSVALTFPVVLFRLELKYMNLFCLTVFYDRSGYGCTVKYGRSELEFVSVDNGKNLIEGDFVPGLHRKPFDVQYVSFGNPVLLSAGFKYCVQQISIPSFYSLALGAGNRYLVSALFSPYKAAKKVYHYVSRLSIPRP